MQLPQEALDALPSEPELHRPQVNYRSRQSGDFMTLDRRSLALPWWMCSYRRRR